MDLVIVSPHNAQTFEAFRKRNYPFNRTFILALDSFVRLANRTQLGPLELIGYIRNELIPMGSTAYSYDDHKTNYRLRMADEDVPDSVLTFFDSGQLRSQLNMSRKAFLTLFCTSDELALAIVLLKLFAASLLLPDLFAADCIHASI